MQFVAQTIIERKIKIRPIYWITVGILASAVIGVQTPFLLEGTARIYLQLIFFM